MGIVPQVAGHLNELLGTEAEAVGKQAGVIQRKRKFTAPLLMSTVVLSLLTKGNSAIGDFVEMAATLGVKVTPKAMRNRFVPQLAEALRLLFHRAVSKAMAAPARSVELLSKFTEIQIGDSTIVTLPEELADEFPGCGGPSGSGKAALKLQVEWNQIDGRMTIDVESGRDSDAKSPMMRRTPKKGSLTVRDLGYFSLEWFTMAVAAGAFFLSRLQPKTKVFLKDGQELDLLSELRAHPWGKPYERWVFMGTGIRVWCRLIVLRMPQEIASQRRREAKKKARKDGRTATDEHLAWMDYSLYVTKCDEEKLTWEEVIVLYRVRWQIELLFKLWKSDNRLALDNAKQPLAQRMAQMWGKLVGVVIQHWILLASAWKEVRHSLRKGAQVFRRRVLLIARALTDLDRFAATLEEIVGQIDHLAKTDRRNQRPAYFQLLENPELLDYTT